MARSRPPASRAASCSNAMACRPCARFRAASSTASRIARRPCTTALRRLDAPVFPCSAMLSPCMTRRIASLAPGAVPRGGIPTRTLYCVHIMFAIAPRNRSDDDSAGPSAQKDCRRSADEPAPASPEADPAGTDYLRTMLRDPGNLTCNEVSLPGPPNHPFTIIAQPTPQQAEAFQRLGLEPSKMFPVPRQHRKYVFVCIRDEVTANQPLRRCCHSAHPKPAPGASGTAPRRRPPGCRHGMPSSGYKERPPDVPL